MSIVRIPLINNPQTFDITINEKEYILTCKYNNSEEGGWVLDFADALTGENIVANVPCITGLNMLEGLEYLGFDGILFVYTDGDQLAVPTYTNLGVESNVYFQPSE